ncbi:MAG: family 78 glycoside hydrolase catalytic domain [Clostridia bacterium]|nr:family 78 glycoside hydrolase catalytic domain [Clostridia bacterium]
MPEMIWLQNPDADKNAYAIFEKEFEIENILPDSNIKISVDSEYALYINGSFVNCGQYDDYPSLKYYDTLMISEFLNCGLNKLTVCVYYQGESSMQYSVGRAGLWFRIECGDFFAESDETTLGACDRRFVQGDIYKTTSQYGYGFCCDARNEFLEFEPVSSFEAPPMLPRPIEKCVLTPTSAGIPIAQGKLIRSDNSLRTPAQLMQSDFLSSRPRSEIFDGENVLQSDVYAIYDMGHESCGYIFFEVEAEEGTVIDIGYGEHLDDMRVRTSIGERNFANRYICSDGEQKFCYPFRRIAGRYIELHIIGRVKKLINVGLVLCEYPLNNISQFKSDDVFLTKLHQISADTLKLCMHEHYEDCPWREQGLYGSDSRNQMLFGYYAFGEYKFARASLDLIGQSVRNDGYITICAPSDNELTIPSFCFLWILAMKEYAEYSKDLSLAMQYKSKLKFIYDTLSPKTENFIAPTPNGRKKWNFYEWSEGCSSSPDGTVKPKEIDGLYNVFLYVGISAYRDIMNMISDAESAKEAERMLCNMKQAINRIFWDNEKNMYCSYIENGNREHYCELMQVMALFSKIADEKSDILKKLITSDNSLVPITMSYAVYKYDVLLESGNEYYRYVYDDITSKWGNMIFSGATSFWETELGADDFDGAGSLCHGWSAAPLYLLEKYTDFANSISSDK